VSTEKPDPADEIRTRALERARAIATAYIDAKGDLGPYEDEYLRETAMALGAAFHAAGNGLHEEADATVERRKKGWQSLSKEFRTVAARLVGIAQDLAELAKLDEPEMLHDAEHGNGFVDPARGFPPLSDEELAVEIAQAGTGEIVTPVPAGRRSAWR
jgi:hypothetical protein